MTGETIIGIKMYYLQIPWSAFILVLLLKRTHLFFSRLAHSLHIQSEAYNQRMRKEYFWQVSCWVIILSYVSDDSHICLYCIVCSAYPYVNQFFLLPLNARVCKVPFFLFFCLSTHAFVPHSCKFWFWSVLVQCPRLVVCKSSLLSSGNWIFFPFGLFWCFLLCSATGC